MMACGWIIYHTVKAEWSTKMVMSTKVCGFKEKEVGMVYLQKDVAIILKGTGLTTWEKDKAHTSFLKKIKYSSDNGLQMPQKREYILKFKTQHPWKYKEKSISQIHTFYHHSIK